MLIKTVKNITTNPARFEMRYLSTATATEH